MKTVGLRANIKLIGKKREKDVLALFDTGAASTSIDLTLAKELDFGEPLRQTFIRNPSLKEECKRDVVKIKMIIEGEEIECEANLQDRSHMTHQVLIGRNVLHSRFIVDVSK